VIIGPSKTLTALTPNFLNNTGWSKREYDSIFTREIVEKQRVILPVWHEISVESVYNFSPILADRLGVQWSLGVEEVAQEIDASHRRADVSRVSDGGLLHTSTRSWYSIDNSAVNRRRVVGALRSGGEFGWQNAEVLDPAYAKRPAKLFTLVRFRP
jgi:hypothetical protein